MGIEPTRPAWKAGVLPLNYTRVYKGGQTTATARVILTHTPLFVKGFAKKITDENFSLIFQNIPSAPFQTVDKGCIIKGDTILQIKDG